MSQDVSSEIGNTKRFRSRKYCFTINNYTVEEKEKVLSHLNEESKCWIVGYEIGKEGTPHIQGFVEYKNQVDFNKLKKIMPRAHIEVAKGTLRQNIDYCSKEKNYEGNFPDTRTTNEKLIDEILISEYSDVVWRGWQSDVLNLLSQPADKRKIYWYWEATGNIGKSYLSKYIGMKYDAIIATGKKNDIFNQIKTYIDVKKKGPKIILIDVPRDTLDYINYGAIEEIKNGCIYSGKYEGGVCYFQIPTIVCFANEEPNRLKMSSDRFVITEIVSSVG